MGKRHSGYRTTEIIDSNAQEEQIQEGTEREVAFHFPHLPNPHPRALIKTKPTPQLYLFTMARREKLTLLNAPESQPG